MVTRKQQIFINKTIEQNVRDWWVWANWRQWMIDTIKQEVRMLWNEDITTEKRKLKNVLVFTNGEDRRFQSQFARKSGKLVFPTNMFPMLFGYNEFIDLHPYNYIGKMKTLAKKDRVQPLGLEQLDLSDVESVVWYEWYTVVDANIFSELNSVILNRKHNKVMYLFSPFMCRYFVLSSQRDNQNVS